MTITNLPVLQKMIEYRRQMMLCQPCFDPPTLTQILRQVVVRNNNNNSDEDPYQQVMNVYRQNLFQAADDSVRASTRRRAFRTVQRLTHAMDVCAKNNNSCTNGSIPTPTTSTPTTTTFPSRDEPSLVSLETTIDASQRNSTNNNNNNKNDIPHSVMMTSSMPSPLSHRPMIRRISLPEFVDECDEGGLL